MKSSTDGIADGSQCRPCPVVLVRAATPADLAAVKRLFLAYLEELAVNLDFQGTAEEFRTFPAWYDCLLLARAADGTPLGAVGSRPLEPGVCEMKRLYIIPQARGLGLGRRLCERLMAEATGFHTMKLDTLARLAPALALYKSLGFTPTAPYNHNPQPDILYFARRL